ncbi:hypothetical protein N0V93_003870 [Gnomoniopsis smithogilvyi]|uniref:Uncharacterized protein n=1 Tax=Gnomoniopsis smithogilvyi TaxID=1191159 RepID=A0A9W8YZI7_9PEZI|nr:hypothetical protein N0V93_003870 [Gnomoniopsis smithogilvyi]
MSRHQEFATMPRHGRFGAQRTPEPCLDGQGQPPVTPRPRFKLKRRHVSEYLAAPTQQFLASVAAADVPIPSIEEPAIADFDSDSLPPWSDLERMENDHENSGLQNPFGRKRLATPPRTPAPEDPPSLTPSRYPNWNIDWMSDCESSPEPESRPSTSQSKRTSSSSFSQLSFCFSDEDVHFSPEITAPEKNFDFNLIETQHDGPQPQSGMSRISRKAPWTKAMCAHLWATYNMYLSDPRVTPFQIGKSGLPPEGVCKRVAREAARSWKGARAVARSTSASDAKSGSSTPTAESSGAFMQWPHTGAATRAQLRVLCKQKARGPDAGKLRFAYFSRSPTPFTNTTARWVRRSTPGATAPPFETHDMSTSLAISTSEAMNPEGPLARLTNYAPESPAPPTPTILDYHSKSSMVTEPSHDERRRLGSPINAKSYGPSASASLTDAFGLPAGAGERQIHTVGPRRRLQSPVRLSRSSTHKRKTGSAHEARKRPSLSTDIWLDPISARSSEHNAAHKKSFSLDYREDDFFASRSQTQLFVDTNQGSSPRQPAAAPMALPQRLGSPFSGSASSFSVPNRFSQPVDFESSVFGRRFSTLHPALSSRPNEPASINLASKLAYIDSRLKDFNNPNGCR